MSDLLSQDEIDALLNGVDSGAVETSATLPPPMPGEVRAYDLSSEDRIAHARFPALTMINERFARTWRVALYSLVRSTVDVRVLGTEVKRYNDYLSGLHMPANLNMVHVKPLRGAALYTCDSSLIFSIVDLFFGGNGRIHTKIEGREFSDTENRVIKLVIDQIFKQVVDAWDPVMKVECERVSSEVNPHFANIASRRDYVVVSSFQVELDGGAGGQFHMVYPYSVLEPIRDLLDSGLTRAAHDLDDASWRAMLREEMQGAEVEVSGVLATTAITLRKLMQLKINDVIPLKINAEAATLKVEHVPVFTGVFGEHNLQNSIKLSRINTARGANNEPSTH